MPQIPDPFEPGKESPEALEYMDASDALVAAVDSISGKVLDRLDKDLGHIERIVGKANLPTNLELPAGGDSMESLEGLESLLSSVVSTESTGTSPDTESELPCCKPGERPKSDKDDGDNGNGGKNGDDRDGEDDPGSDPPKTLDCFDADGNPIPCPDVIPDGAFPITVRTLGGESVSLPAFAVKGFIEQQHAHALSQCPPDADCNFAEPACRPSWCEGETETEPADCRVCTDEEPGPEDECSKCPTFLCYYNRITCDTVVVSSDELQPEPPFFLVDEYNTRAVAEARCREMRAKSSEVCKPNEPREPVKLNIEPCNEEFIQQLGDAVKDPEKNAEFMKDFYQTITGAKCDEAGFFDIIRRFSENPASAAFDALVCSFGELTGRITSALGEVLPQKYAGAVRPIGLEVLFGVFDRWVGDGLDRFKATAQQAANYQMPYKLPNAYDSISAFIAGQADGEQAKRWAKMDGFCPDQWGTLVDAAQRIPSVGELVNAELRGIISSSEYEELHRKSGFIDERMARIHRELGVYIPPVTDIIRFMVRDVVDDNVVRRFRYDDDFREKYIGETGELKKFANSQGISDETMKLYWRAHWQLPSVSQALELYHRFRYDDIPVRVRTTKDDVRTVLKAQDIPEFWVDRYIEASFLVPTRVDGARMLKIGKIDADGYKRILQRQGYSDDDAQQLTDFRVKEKSLSAIGERPMRAYKAGLIDRGEAIAQMEFMGYAGEDIAYAVRVIDSEFKGQTRKTCTASLKTRYMQGEFTKQQAMDRLQQLGWDLNRVQSLADRWECQRIARPKLATVRIMREMIEFNLIDAKEAVIRMINFGFRKPDAIDTVATMVSRVTAKTFKAVAAERNKIEKELERTTKRLATDRRVESNAADRIRRQNERERKAKDTANNKLATAVNAHNAKFGSEYEPTFKKASELREGYIDRLKLNGTTANNAVISAIRAGIKQDIEDFATLADDIADSFSE